MKVRWFTKACMLALSLALFGWPATAPAQDSLTSVATTATFLNTGAGTGSAGSTLFSSQWEAVQFTLINPSAITDVQGYFGPYGTSGAVNIVIWTNNDFDPTLPVPGQAIWSQSYTLTAPATTAAWVNFPGYLAVLAPGTYWVAFEAPPGSTVNVGMLGPPTTPAANSAFFDGGINTWINFTYGNGHSTNYPAAIVSGYDLGTASGTPLITSGTFARTVTQGSIFNSPCGQNLGPYGNIGQADTLQWNICPGVYSASAYGTIASNPKTSQGNILEAGAYSNTGPNGSSGAARGIVFSTYLNTTGKDIPNVQANALLDGSIAGAGSNSPVTVAAAVYVFDPASFTNYINSVVPTQYPTLGYYLLGGNNVVAGVGSYYAPNLGQDLFGGHYVDDSWDNNSQYEVCNGTNCPQGYEVSTAGFDLPANALFTVMFDVSAASEGSASAQTAAIGDFLSTLEADPQYFFTDGNTSVNNGLGNVISGIAGPLTMALPDTPANISLSPSTQSTAVGSTTVVTATVTDASNNPVPNAIVRFSVTSGPHAGFSMPVGTGDGNNGTTLGVATFIYTDTLGTAGTDSISASVGSISAPTPAQVTWTTPGPLYTITLTPPTTSISLGNSQTYDATGTDYFGNSLGDVTSQLTFSISPDGSCTGATCTPAVAGPHTVKGAGSNPVVGTITGTASLTVTGATLSTPTITFGTAPAPTYLGGNFTVSATTNSNGALTYAYVSGPCAQVSGGTFSSSGAGMCVIQANTAATSTYSAGSAQQSVTIAPATATITFGTAPSPTYLGGNFTVSATSNSTAAVTYSFVSGPCAQVSGAIFSSSGAGTCVVQAGTAATANYTAASVTQNVTISPAATTITFGTAPTPTYLGGNFAVSATTNSTGTVTYSYVSGPCAQVSGGSFSSSGAGLCVVQASVAATTNYAAASTTQNVTISPATTTITFGAAPSPTYLGGNFTVSATTNSTGALSFSAMSGPCAFVSATATTGTFSSSGGGTCVVQASVVATTNFSAGSTTQNVTISPATPTVTFGTAPAPTYLGGNFTVSATTNSNGALTYSYVSGPCAQVSGGTFSSTGGGLCVVQASTAATANFSAGSTTQNVTISPATPTITFGTAPAATYPGSNFTVSATTNSNAALSYSYVSGPCAQVSGGTFSPSGTGTCVVQASTASTSNFTVGSATQGVVISAATGKTNPVITWPAPAPITYGTPLSGAQLDATANVAGTFAYNPAAKTILTAGMHTLSVTFTPTDTTDYNTATAMVTLQVNQATPPVLWVPVPIVYGTPLGQLQLDALTEVPGTFVYTPPAGTVLHAGNQTLSATFTPKDTTDFQTITVHATLIVLKANPDVDWAQPAAITAGTPLSGTQLDATANVGGGFAYNPPAGTILPAGTYVLKVTFTPADPADYQSASAQVSLTVKPKK